MATKIERIAGLAMAVGHKHLADDGAVRSRHAFTQRQLMSCLILRGYLKTTDRGLIDLLARHAGLRRILGLERKLPHHATLQQFSARKDVLAVADAMIAQIRGRPRGRQPAIAINSTGMETTTASARFQKRRFPSRKTCCLL